MAADTAHDVGGVDLSGFHSLRNNPISNFIFGSGAPQQPTVGGPAKDPSKLVRDPATGMFYDPTTGTSYTDATGQTVIANPNVAQQVARNIQTSNQFMDVLHQQQQQQQQTFGQQQQLADTFKNIIAGKAPSPAAIQAQLNANDVARSQLAAAAGSSGASSPLASLMAARNSGQAQIQANNAGVLGRTTEEANAGNALNQLYNAMQTSTGNTMNTNTQAFEDTNKLAESGQEAQQGLNAKANEQNSNQAYGLGGAFFKALGNLI